MGEEEEQISFRVFEYEKGKLPHVKDKKHKKKKKEFIEPKKGKWKHKKASNDTT